MTDSDIQFGEMEQARPGERRRPDRDGHFAVATCGAPAERDLPVFVDMDVLADMEAHARSDPSVELGGVMLGGQFVDEEGHPFVLVVDSLRAEHYESSGGHFKFTHETWTQIGRRREGFSGDLQMVGWYHTHPGLGVFLSGRDRFICEHFFNRPLDVALVIDPVRGDRGWFYWGRDGAERLPQAEGFRVVASRFRRRQLAHYTELLEGQTAMETERAASGSPLGPGRGLPHQVIHSIQPRWAWVGAAIVGILVVQVFATLLVALRIGAPTVAVPKYPPREPPRKQEREADLDRRAQRLAAREQAFERLLGHVQVGPDGKLTVKSLVEENAKLHREVDRLTKLDVLLDELSERFQQTNKERDDLKAGVGRLEQSKQELSARTEELEGQIGELTASREADKEAAEKEIARLKAQLAAATQRDVTTQPGGEDAAVEAKEPPSPDADAGAGLSTGTIVAVVVVGLVAAGALAAVFLWKKRAGESSEAGPSGGSEA